MTIHRLDTRGLHVPKPVLKITEKAVGMKPGDILEIVGDGKSFEHDVRALCQRLDKVAIYIKDDDGKRTKVQIQF